MNASVKLVKTLLSQGEVSELKQLRKEKRAQHRNIKLMIKQERERRQTNLYLSDENTERLLNDVSDKAAVLHFKYVDKVDDTCIELTDEYMASVTGWSVRSVARCRLQLEKANWFRKYTGSIDNNSNFRATYYLLDRDSVIKYMTEDDFRNLLLNDYGVDK